MEIGRRLCRTRKHGSSDGEKLVKKREYHY